MTAQLLLGKPVAADLQAATHARSLRLQERLGRLPRLTIVAFGDDPAAGRYFRQIQRSARSANIEPEVRAIDLAAGPVGLKHALKTLNGDDTVDAVLVQLPLPDGWEPGPVADLLDPAKDVDGISPRNVGYLAQGRWAPVPNTARAGLAVLEHYEIPVASRRVVIVGRSTIVGRPLGYLLLNRDATVTICHSKTADLAAVTREAEILLVATGRSGLIRGAAVRPGAVVLDFGSNVGADGQPRGDVDAATVAPVAGALTPVPGGIGPVTTACLLASVVDLAERRAGQRS